MSAAPPPSRSAFPPPAPAGATPPATRPLVLFIAILAVAAVAVGGTLHRVGPAVDSPRLAAAVGLACFAVLADLLTYRLPGGGLGSVALIPFLAIILVSPEWTAVAAVAAAAAVTNLACRRPLVKLAFNVAQTSLSAGLAALVYRAAGGRPLGLLPAPELLGWETAVAGLALLAAFVVVNTGAVSGVLSITEGRRVVGVWRANTLSTAPYFVFAGPLAFGLGWVYLQLGPLGAIVAAVPVLGIRQLYATTLRLQATNRELAGTTLQLRRTNRELLEFMVKALEARDPYTSGHSRRVADVATVIARSLELGPAQIERVRVAALLHDVGKIHESFAPILSKPGALTDEEWGLLRTHPSLGADLVATLSDLRDLVGPVRHHHERWDGRGYPDGLAGDSIPLAARIIALADTLDAMLSDRPYRTALTADEVRREFRRHSGTQFDPVLCERVLTPRVWGQLFPADVRQAATAR